MQGTNNKSPEVDENVVDMLKTVVSKPYRLICKTAQSNVNRENMPDK